MRILWLTESPSKYKMEKTGYNGRGWIESLQSILENCTEVDQLGIAFSHKSDSKKIEIDHVTYYPIKQVKPKHLFSRIISNWKNKIDINEEIDPLYYIIKDFKPDVIHIFGTESWLCNAVKMSDVPTLVHLQGIILPILNAYIPAGISQLDLVTYNFRDFIKGTSLWHMIKKYEKMAQREYIFLKNTSYFTGRTDWDNSISSFLSPKSKYFHIDEVLRDIFYEAAPWKFNNLNKIIITSTLSDSMYKGLDVIIKTAKILIKEGFDFEWRIIGIKNDSYKVNFFRKILKLDLNSLNMNLLGIKRAEEIVSLLSETTIYVHTSYIDNSPNSLCEAQMLGVPVISTNVGGISTLVADTIDGFLVPSNDPYLLASKIALLGHSEEILTKISFQAREKARKRHSKENITKQLIETYKYLTAN